MLGVLALYGILGSQPCWYHAMSSVPQQRPAQIDCAIIWNNHTSSIVVHSSRFVKLSTPVMSHLCAPTCPPPYTPSLPSPHMPPEPPFHENFIIVCLFSTARWPRPPSNMAVVQNGRNHATKSSSYTHSHRQTNTHTLPHTSMVDIMSEYFFNLHWPYFWQGDYVFSSPIVEPESNPNASWNVNGS